MATFEQILSDLKQKKYAPIYLLYGEEAYFIDQITDYISKHVLSEAEKGFNQTVFYGRDANPGAIIETAKRFPMMAERQVVIIKEAQDLKGIDQLEDYAATPSATTLLVLAHKYKKPDGRKKVVKNIKKTGVVFESKPVYENQMAKWIGGYIGNHHRNIDPKATMLLCEAVGTNISIAVNEIEKLFITCPEGATINAEMVAKGVGINNDYNNYELQNALGEKNLGKAMKIANYFAQNQKAHPLVVTMTLLSKFYTNLMLMYFQPNTSDNELARLLGVHPFFLSQYTNAKRNYPAQQVVKIIELIRTYDLKSKGVNQGGATPGELLKELVFKIIAH
jgi:DNA polymerase-3 subunit delta